MERNSTRLTFHDVHQLHTTNERAVWDAIGPSRLEQDLAPVRSELRSQMTSLAEAQTRRQVGLEAWGMYKNERAIDKRKQNRRGTKQNPYGRSTGDPWARRVRNQPKPRPPEPKRGRRK